MIVLDCYRLCDRRLILVGVVGAADAISIEGRKRRRRLIVDSARVILMSCGFCGGRNIGKPRTA